MHTFFIADSDAEIRKRLKYILKWNHLDFTCIGEADSGEKALADILRLKPDLVLTDIVMPQMTGLDIVHALRARDYQGQIIIISALADFQCAQDAMRNDVSQYLTKPVDSEELFCAVKKVAARLAGNERYAAEQELLKPKIHDALLGRLVTGQISSYSLYWKNLSLDADVYQIVTYENFRVEHNDMAYSFAELLKVTNEDSLFFEYFEVENKDMILLKGSYALERFQYFLDHYENTPPQAHSPLDSLFIVYGRPVYDLMSIRESYLDAVTLLGRRFFCSENQHTFGFSELPAPDAVGRELSAEKLDEFCAMLTDYLQTFNRKKLAESFAQIEHYLHQTRSSVSDIKLFLADLYLQIKEKMNHIYDARKIPFPSNSATLKLIYRKKYLFEILAFFSEQAEMIMAAISNSSQGSVLDDVLYYIDHNYQANIRLETIAPLFGYNSAYLGKIFTGFVGETFNSYLDHMRIERAKELLLENQLKVYEIAAQVGYRNVDYFHKKFQKYVGKSPNEFRRQAEKDGR